jgi:hypothetical protein
MFRHEYHLPELGECARDRPASAVTPSHGWGSKTRLADPVTTQHQTRGDQTKDLDVRALPRNTDAPAHTELPHGMKLTGFPLAPRIEEQSSAQTGRTDGAGCCSRPAVRPALHSPRPRQQGDGAR